MFDTHDLTKSATNNHYHDEGWAAELIIALKQLFDDRSVSSRRDLTYATSVLAALEGLPINRASEAYGELERLRRIWKNRLRAQEDIDRWMIQHGHPLY
jgi:hypothetical protein